ncbi:hypothetical protein [Deinococcus yavapaiensis]|uniref:Heat induced stress protein YflT n=1 Tax=Deinococcus yavapaiensis KR-236 TaxID=694435 RepID=A0A318SNF2_9DEIO|nr:hypothetical protein [Deinococcus yavapaiensis]PYE56432.1 hypothetical protein DES52_101236 [Deinococcus yavapaiensis KR-236]
MENVVALFNEPTQARNALQTLLQRGFSRDRLAFSLLDPVAQEELAAETGVSHEEGAPAGSGAVLRGIGLGALAGVGLAIPAWILMLVIPEARPLASGGLLGVMFGALGGGSLGGLFGALSGGDHGDYVKLLERFGVPERIAASYYDALKAGKVMVIVRDADEEYAEEATRILQQAGATDSEGGTSDNEGQLSTEREVHGGPRRR